MSRFVGSDVWLCVLKGSMKPAVIIEIQKFAEAMQHKIDKNAHKDNWPNQNEKGERSWKSCEIDFLLKKLEEEHTELVNAVVTGEPIENIRNEAADVGNLAMMIADRLGALDA